MSMAFGLPVPIQEFKAAGDHWTVEGYVSTYGNRDLGDDVVMPGAFDRWLASGKKTRFLFSHRPDKIVGTFPEVRSDKYGLFVKGKISKTPLGEEMYTLLKDGALDSFSIGYNTIQADYDGPVRLLKDLDLPESSLVAMGMNEQALVTGVKNYLAILGIKADMTLAEKANALSDGLNQLISDTRQLVGGADRSLTQTKRQELTELLEMFSGLDAVRSDLTTVLAAAPTVRASGKRALYELAEHRRRLAYILTP